jgi:hypothetical protein
MAREMTPQERAAATRLCIDLLSIIHSDPHPIDEPCGQCLAAIRLYAQGTRRAALLEVAELHQEWRNGKHSGTFSDLLRHKLAQEG